MICSIIDLQTYSGPSINDFSKALEFLHNRVGKHNTVLSLTEAIIVLAALSAEVNFFLVLVAAEKKTGRD